MRARTMLNAPALATDAPRGASGSRTLFDLVGFLFGLVFAVLALTAVQAVARASAPGAASIDPYEFPDED